MIATKKKHSVAKKKLKGRTLHDILHEGLMHRMARFEHFANTSLRIHVEFLNDDRGKEKDR